MKKLFDELMELVATTDGMFFFKDTVLPSHETVRIFSYNYASYTQWLLPGALEARGIMFLMNGSEPVSIMCRPMEKFFNLNETPFTMNLDYSKVQNIMAKADGSLISSYINTQGYLGLKSKTSVTSEQAIAARQLISTPKYEALLYRVIELALDGWTCNFEYVAPDNRIVLQYQEPELILLNVRHNETGEYAPYKTLMKDNYLRTHLVPNYEIDLDSETWVEDVRNLEGIEGFIFDLGDQRFKLKTKWYCALHHTKDSITNNERLFGTIVAGASDDIKGMFESDEYAKSKIEAFEKIYLDYLRTSISTITSFIDLNAGIDRKAFALKAQQYANQAGYPFIFSTMMNMYSGQMDQEKMVENLGSLFLKNWKKFVPAAYLKEVVISEE